MEKIRVLLANHPVMIPDVMRQLVSCQGDMELVGDCRGPMTILEETGRTKADAVIVVQEKDQEWGLSSQLLAVYPDLIILGFMLDMDSAYIQRVCYHRTELKCVQAQALMQALREAARQSSHVEDSRK